MELDEIKYYYIDSDSELSKHIETIKSSQILAIDTETTGLDPYLHRIRLLQIAVPGSPVLVIDLWKLGDYSLKDLKKAIPEGAVKVFQNAKFDLKFLLVQGFAVSGQVFDTMLAAQIARKPEGPDSFNLEALVGFYLGQELPKEEQKSDWSSELSKKQLIYAAKDAAVLLLLRERILKDIREGNLIEVCKLEFDCLWAVVDMELNGMEIDRSRWQSLYEKYLAEQRTISEKLYRELEADSVQMNIFGEIGSGGINLDSQTQVLNALRKKGIILNSTSQYEVMEYRDKYEAVNLLLEYRRISKAIQGFLAPIPEYINPVTGRIHSSYRQLGAHSGRFSCGNPNIQQIPRGKDFRECFICGKGKKLVIADYSQIELRVAAEIAQDKTMMEAYRNGQDLHALTASLIANKGIESITKKERQAAKAVNFGLIYAMGARGLQGYSRNTYGVEMSLEEAELFRERFFKAYKGIAAWHEKTKKLRNVHESRTLSGRRCIYDREPGITALLNTPVQGTAADITKKALGMLVPVVKKIGGSIVGTVHDEILLEVSEEDAEKVQLVLKTVMEQAGSYYLKNVPVIAETTVAENWAEK